MNISPSKSLESDRHVYQWWKLLKLARLDSALHYRLWKIVFGG